MFQIQGDLGIGRNVLIVAQKYIVPDHQCIRNSFVNEVNAYCIPPDFQISDVLLVLYYTQTKPHSSIIKIPLEAFAARYR
jgi:hypothetical protein